MDEDATLDRESEAAVCPSRAELAAFNRGRLPSQRMETVARHIGVCRACELALRDFSDESDPLVLNLRSSNTDEVAYHEEPECRRLEARARAIFQGSSDPAMRPPRWLGQYELVRKIKGGGMGDVYEAMHTRLKRRVALKTLRADRMHEPQLLARFHREIAAVGKLEHANIVRASDAGEAEGWHYLVMDFVDGLDLGTLVRAIGALPTADAAEIARQAALGLQCVNENGFVHRDVKPSNLMLDVHGHVKILDLGLALLYEAAAGDELTETGMGMGTADYMSPEQALDSHQVKIQSDLYSLGCTLYKLLAGRAPFDTPSYRTPVKKMKAHVSDAPPLLREHLPDLPPALADIVHKLLEKQPERRFATPGELAAALTPFAVGSDLRGLLHRARAHETALSERGPQAHAGRLALPRPGVLPRQPAKAGRQLLVSASVAIAALCVVALVVIYPPWGSNVRPDVPKQQALKIAWPDDFPEALRDRPEGKRIALVERGKRREGPRQPHEGNVFDGGGKGPTLPYQPLWSRRLAGTGLYYSHRLNLTLNSAQFDAAQGFRGLTVLALDDDRAYRWFELDVELWPTWPAQNGQPQARGGIFFGWRPADKDGFVGAYFVQLMDRVGPDQAGPAGSVVVKHVMLPADPVEAGQQDAAFDLLAVNPLAALDLPETAKRYKLHVTVTREQVSLRVGDDAVVAIRAPLEARGALGIWARNGEAWFGDVSVTALSPPTVGN